MAAGLGPAEITARVDEFRRLLAREVRRRLDRRSVRDGGGIRRSSADLEDLPILGASPSDLAALQRALRPLARRLAVRGARRRRFTRRGRLDVRRTIRRSLSTGGVPVQPLWRRPRTTRPELVVLCDVSGSVAEFARFTLALMSAMSAEFSALRCFAFVDGVDEVTRIVADAQGALMPAHVLARTDVVWDDGHSDYGRVWSVFTARFSAGAHTAIQPGHQRRRQDQLPRGERRGPRRRWRAPSVRSTGSIPNAGNTGTPATR